MNTETIARICDAISGGLLADAATIARAELPFEPFERPKRKVHRNSIYLVCYPFRAPECIKLNAAIFRFTLVLSDLNVFT